MSARAPRGLYDPATEHGACGVGFVVQISGEKSRDIVEQGLEVLRRLSHRGACGCDPETGDGAGILLQLPHRFFKREGLALGFEMPRRRRYGIGQIFLPRDPRARAACERIVEEVIVEEGQRVLGWRDVGVDPAQVGRIARAVMPVIRQVFVGLRRLPPSAFERKLYAIRKLARKRIIERGVDPAGRFHVASLSTEMVVYKGLMLPHKLSPFYDDLRASDMVSAIALVHSRFSTNTFPTWDLAQPFRHIAHNGEINTLRGNRNWMMARRSQLQSAKFGGPLDRLFPIIDPGKSDSAQFDNMVELLHLAGRSLPHAMMMMIPEAWEEDPRLDPGRRAFYEYASALIEPWDGPAAIAFTDGTIVGATLDRNGLRPARFLVTDDGRVILASETGVLDIPPQQIVRQGRLQPGRMLLIDTAEQRIIDDEEVKGDLTGRWPYARWLKKNVFDIGQFPGVEPLPRCEGEALRRLQRAFGYTDEDLRLVLWPMAEGGKEPVGSMGSDTPLAVLSDRAPNLFDYFHQLFAQVTNPPIDPLRERLVMTLETTIGPDGNTFEETPEQCHRLRLTGPILTNAELQQVAMLQEGAFEARRLSLLYRATAGPEALRQAVRELCDQAAEAIDEGHAFLILSDRGVDAKHVAIPALLAVSAVQQHLVRAGIRMQAGLLVETAEARRVHDFALLVGYGAAAINPYLALDTIHALAEQRWAEAEAERGHAAAVEPPPAEPRSPGDLPAAGERSSPAEQSSLRALRRYITAVELGLLKIMSKMGISTLQSYRGAQIFEAVGLDRELIDAHFSGTPSRLSGVGLRELGREVLERHGRGFGPPTVGLFDPLPLGGQLQWRPQGERHKWNPATIARLQAATRLGDRAIFREYCALVEEEGERTVTLRGLLELDSEKAEPVALDEVEPVSAIVRRFVSGAMSFGSISAEAHETLAIAMNRLGARSNSGEGGEESRRFLPDENGDLRRSAIKQVASGRFGVTSEYLVNADDLQIKIAQGAKPGEGGQLPGHKVDERIARVRCSTPGVSLISPPPHHDIYSIEDLAQLIYDLQMVQPRARISVKLVSQVGVGTVAAGVAKARAGCVVIAGYEGGTGAAALSSIHHAGLPWELGLAEAQQVLLQNNLRGRVVLQVDGGLRSGRDVVVAALLGAEEFGFATAPLIALGCVMLRKCHLNTCSVGVATQRPELRQRFAGRPEWVVNFFEMVAEQVRELMAGLGFRTMEQMVGRVDRLRLRPLDHWKGRRLDLGAILAQPEAPKSWPRHFVERRPWSTDDHVDRQLLDRVRPALQRRQRLEISLPINNRQRAAGTLLSGMIARELGARPLPKGTVTVRFRGSAGQSFGAFAVAGVTLWLAGDANDYLGKGLCGGRIILHPPPGSRLAPEENVIVGNTVLYGATSGEVLISGQAGERFAVRNSGARAVVEGVGDHGCEYMTGGVVVVLGPTGRNFAAGMSGGLAYVFDREQRLAERCNRETVELQGLVDESEIWLVYGMIEAHQRHTGSPLGRRILDNWEHLVTSFVKVMPVDYKRALQARRAASGPPRSWPPQPALTGER